VKINKGKTIPPPTRDCPTCSWWNPRQAGRCPRALLMSACWVPKGCLEITDEILDPEFIRCRTCVRCDRPMLSQEDDLCTGCGYTISVWTPEGTLSVFKEVEL